MSKKNELDQYYTKGRIADKCWDKILEIFPNTSDFVEPSAGAGAFLRKDLKIQGYDLDPKCEGVVKKDFLQLESETLLGKIVVGNPPFGWASSLALKFINKSCKADAICFILPKTFMKKVFQEKIDKFLHLEHEEVLPKNSFILEGEDYDVPCCFQIWVRKSYTRDKLDIKTFVKEDEKGEFFLRRVGGRAGQFVSKEDYNKSSTYKVECSKETKELIEKCYPLIKEVASQTAGVRSITLKEINLILTEQEEL